MVQQIKKVNPAIWVIVVVILTNFANRFYDVMFPSQNEQITNSKNIIVIPQKKFDEIIETIGGKIEKVEADVLENRYLITQNLNNILLINKINEFQDYKIQENKH